MLRNPDIPYLAAKMRMRHSQRLATTPLNPPVLHAPTQPNVQIMERPETLQCQSSRSINSMGLIGVGFSPEQCKLCKPVGPQGSGGRWDWRRAKRATLLGPPLIGVSGLGLRTGPPPPPPAGGRGDGQRLPVLCPPPACGRG